MEHTLHNKLPTGSEAPLPNGAVLEKVVRIIGSAGWRNSKPPRDIAGAFPFAHDAGSHPLVSQTGPHGGRRPQKPPIQLQLRRYQAEILKIHRLDDVGLGP